MATDLALAPLPELLRLANQEGARFRLAGARVQVNVSATPALTPVLAALKARRDELWALLGGNEADVASLALLAKLKVEPVVPVTPAEAEVLIAEMETDGDTHTAADIRAARGGVLGLDIETAPRPGEDTRPPVKLRLKDGLPAKKQPALKGDAGLDPHRATIRLVQLYGGGKRCLVLDTTRVPLTLLADVLARRVVLIHNASFELRFLTEAGLAVPRFEDTMQATGLLLGVHRRGLDEAASAYLGITLPKGPQRSDWSAAELSPGQIAYAALDSIVAFRLWPRLRNELLQKQRGAAYVLHRDATPATVRMMQRGITLDRAAHRQQISEWQRRLASALSDFTATTGQSPPEKPDEVRAFLVTILPADVIAAWPLTGKQRALSIKAPELKRHVDVPAIRALLEIGATTKLLNSFGETLDSKVSAATSRLHPSYNIAATKAGRFSASNPNVQQIPKHKAAELRAGFVAGKGMKLVIADYSAMELRALAAVAADAAMNADFAANVDLHRRQAAEVLGIKQDQVTPRQRDAAKAINFGTIYGAGPKGLQAAAWSTYGLVLSLDETRAARLAFLTRYPQVAAWQDASYVRSNQLGCIVIGRLGRVIEASWEHHLRVDTGKYNWRFPGELDELPEEDEELTPRLPLPCRPILKRTLCCNAPIQGACADASMLALTWIDTALIEAGISGGPVLFVHDEIVLEVSETEADEAGAMLVDCMQRAFRVTFPEAPLNGLVELKIRDAWGAAK
jgi:DNA polymerase I-like protein with 3'-5' exonuclease and polymerase domains